MFNGVGWLEHMNSNDVVMWRLVCGLEISDGVSMCFNDCFSGVLIKIQIYVL